MNEAAGQGPRTPSMFASWMVIVVMIALILLSVTLFGGDMADGALQVSITLATIFALAVAYYYGYRGSVISNAIHSGVNGAVGTVFVVIAIGTVIGTLYLSGTVAAFIYYGSDIISPRFFFVTVFLIASALTVMLGSSLTTVGAVGIAFVGSRSLPTCRSPSRPAPRSPGQFSATRWPRSPTQPMSPCPRSGVTSRSTSIPRPSRVPRFPRF